MTREEAIKILRKRQRFCKVIADHANATVKADELREAEAIETAITALRPVSQKQVEKVWMGEWEDMREAYNDVPKRRCSRCKSVFIGLDTPFCEACGAPMTDKAVDMVMERIKMLNDR